MKQFENPANPAIHEKTTGPEIWDDTEGKIDVLVSGVGTGGTLTGCRATSSIPRARDPHRRSRADQLAGDQPDPRRSGTRALTAQNPGIGAGFIPKNLDLSLVDRVEQVSNEEAISTARSLAREEGMLCGISCGAAMAAALRLAKEPAQAGKTIVVILPDAGERYLSGALFEGLFEDVEKMQAVA